MKKKYGLFKVLAVLLFLVVIATYFIKGRGGNIQYLALCDVFFDYVQSFYYFFDTALFILAVGGFYGVLNRIPAYKKLVQKTSKKFSEKSKLFVIIVTVVFALLSSLTGLNFMLLLFVPFVVSVVLMLGYDKLVAISSTIGGILVGLIGGVFVTLKDSSSQYASSYVTFEKMVGMSRSWNVSTTLPKCVLLVGLTVLLVLYILGHIKHKDEKYQLTTNDPLFIEVKDKSGKKLDLTKNSKIKVWPLMIVMSVMLVLLVLGYLPWSDLFGVGAFDKFHDWLIGLSIGKYAVFPSLISSNISAFGKWNDLGSYMMAIFLMGFIGLILSLIYRIKFDDMMEGFVYGVKKMIVPVMLVMLAYTVLVCSYNNGFVETIITNVTKSFGDNVVTNSFVTILGSILNVDLYYASSGVFTSLISALPEKINLSVYTLMFQSLYGVVQFAGPTSLLMIVGLSYLEVPYKSWVKYIWRFLIEMLMVIFVVLMIVSLV